MGFLVDVWKDKARLSTLGTMVLKSVGTRLFERPLKSGFYFSEIQFVCITSEDMIPRTEAASNLRCCVIFEIKTKPGSTFKSPRFDNE